MVVQDPRSTLQWVDKHRPHALDDISLRGETLRTLKNAVETSSVPHLLFHGPPGTGKTTTAIALAKAIYGRAYKDNVLEMNASHDRGVQIVRENIKNFAKRLMKDPPYFRIIVLDESDFMTKDAQNALRRTVEDFSNTARFIFICNYVSKIIPAIVSRCMQIRFSALTIEQMGERIKGICAQEGISLDEMGIDTLRKVTGGDMRKAITTLQCAVRIGGYNVTSDAILSTTGYIPDEVIQGLLDSCRAEHYMKVVHTVQEVLGAGYSPVHIVERVPEVAFPQSTPQYTQLQKAKIRMSVADARHRVVNGGSGLAELLNLFMSIRKVVLAGDE